MSATLFVAIGAGIAVLTGIVVFIASSKISSVRKANGLFLI